MSIIKNVSGPYTINTINHDDPITLDSNVVIINGRLQVYGNTFLGNVVQADVQQTYVADNIITLNKGWSGSPLLPAGIEVDRGTSSSVFLLWNEPTLQWQVKTSTGLVANILSTSTGLTKLNEDPAPELSANLNVGPNYISSNTNVSVIAEGISSHSLRLDSNLALKIYTTAPAPVVNYNILHGGPVAAGGTGVYVTTGDNSSPNDELISKKKAIVYSIIF
jgi:hypothetical protein